MNDLRVLYQSGACVNAPLDEFIDEPISGKPAEVPGNIASICLGCEVRQQCLDWALDHDEYGIWAGTTRKVREGLARGIRRAKCPACACDLLWTTPAMQVCVACGLSWAASKEHSQSPRRHQTLTDVAA